MRKATSKSQRELRLATDTVGESVVGLPSPVAEGNPTADSWKGPQATEHHISLVISSGRHRGTHWTFGGGWTRAAEFQNELHKQDSFLGAAPKGPWQCPNRIAAPGKKRSHTCKPAAPWSLLLRMEENLVAPWLGPKGSCVDKPLQTRPGFYHLQLLAARRLFG